MTRNNIKPADVFRVRIWLPQNLNRLISASDLIRNGSIELVHYIDQHNAGPNLYDASGPLVVSARDVRNFMQKDRPLVELYERGKAERNPSGRTCRIHRRNGPVYMEDLE